MGSTDCRQPNKAAEDGLSNRIFGNALLEEMWEVSVLDNGTKLPVASDNETGD